MDERSARVRKFSEKLKPSPVQSKQRVSENVIEEVSATTREMRYGNQDTPRADGVMGDVGAGLFAVTLEDLPLTPVFPAPVLTSRRARAPKLMRLANGVEGWLGREEDGESVSSKGLSSTDAEVAVETLSDRLRLKADCCGGEPDMPRVLSDSRRRWAWAAAVAMGPGYEEVMFDIAAAWLAEAEGRPKRSVRV